MPGGRFASRVVLPYEAAKVFTNCCNSAASISIVTAGLNQTTAPTFSINISNQNICVACNYSLATNTYNYSDMQTVLVTNTNVYDGIVCIGTTQCLCFKKVAFVSNTGVANTFISCNGYGRDYYYPVPYPSDAIYGKTNCCGVNSQTGYSLIPTGVSSQRYLMQITNCYCGSGTGALPISCFYCQFISAHQQTLQW